MDLAPNGSDLVSLYLHIGAAILFGLVFAYVWWHSHTPYFGLWSFAWFVEAAAISMGFAYMAAGRRWLVPYAVLEFGFAVLLVAAARTGLSGTAVNWKESLRVFAGLPAFLVVAYALGSRSSVAGYHLLHALVLCSVYLYHAATLRGGKTRVGVFRFSLLCLSILFLQHAVAALYLFGGAAPDWLRRLQAARVYDFGLHALLGFSAMAMRIDYQNSRVNELEGELARIRTQIRLSLDMDRLTGLLNQAALEGRLDKPERFSGVVAVCDMDNFKEINDGYGHLAGDEILRNVGQLVRSSIRREDEAFRWGGDEFVILFHNQKRELVESRMKVIQERLRSFQLRGFGALPISFSWGTADCESGSLREALDEADRNMYTRKRHFRRNA